MSTKKKQLSINVDLSKKDNQVGLSIAIFLFVLVFLILLIIRPNILAINANFTRLHDRQEALGSLDTKLQLLNTAQANYNAIANRLPLINEAVPDNTHLRETLAILERNASDVVTDGQEPLAITSINIVDAPDVTAFNQRSELLTGGEQRQNVTIMVSVRGNYFAVSNFIKRIKSNRRNFQVERLSISAPENSQGNVLDVMVTLNHFYYEDSYGTR